MVCEVGAAICQCWLERGIAEQPPAAKVVCPPLREQQPVSGLVSEDVETNMAPRQEQKRKQIRPPRVDDTGDNHDPERLGQGAEHSEHIAGIRNSMEFVAPRLCWSPPFVETIVREHGRQH